MGYDSALTRVNAFYGIFSKAGWSWAMCQAWILPGEQSSLPTRIAMKESVSLSVRMKIWLRLSNFNQRYKQRPAVRCIAWLDVFKAEPGGPCCASRRFPSDQPLW